MPFDPSAVRSGTVFSTNPTYQAAWICYINGVETPIMGFDIQCGVWQVPTFNINLIPDILLQRLGNEDRIPVQIFYLDYWFDPEHPEFRLLVDGEIIGWRYTSAPGQRSMSFSCVAHIHIFQQLYFFYMTNVDDIVAAQSPEVQAQGFTQAGLLYPYSLFHQGLLVTRTQVADATPPPRRRPGAAGQDTTPPSDAGDGAGDTVPGPIKAPFELMFNVVKGVISKEIPNSRRAVPMMNFFARHIRKTRFHNRFVRLPFLEDPEQLADRKGVFPIFNAARNEEALNAMQRQTVSQIGNSGPVWNVLQQIYSMVYMEIAMITNPAAVIVELNQAPSGGAGATATPTTTPTPAATAAAATGTPVAATTATVTPPSPSPAATADAPVTAAASGEQQDGKIIGILSSATNIIDRNAPTAEEQAQALSALREARSQSLFSQIVAFVRGESALDPELLAEAGFTSVPSAEIEVNQTQIRAALERAEGIRARLTGTPRRPPRPLDEGVEPMNPIRLAQYFVKPQMFFGIPPHCNVIFPSMVDAWTYDEPYLTQPTRIYVNDSVMTNLLQANGPNRHFMLHALTVAFPEEANALMEHKSGGDREGSATTPATPAMMESGKNLLIWPEEYYKGPVTAKLALPSWFQMLRQFSNANEAGGNAGGASDDTPSTSPSQTTTPNPSASPTVTANDQAAQTITGGTPVSNVAAVPRPPLTNVVVPPTITGARRGVVTTRAQAAEDWPYRWIISPETLAIGNSKNVRYTDSPKFGDFPNYAAITSWQQPVSRSLDILEAHLRSLFPAIDSYGKRGRHPTLPVNPERRLDAHVAGYAVDLNIEKIPHGPPGTPRHRVHLRPNLEQGTPIAEYLIQNCDVFGIQYLIWCRSQWNSQTIPGRHGRAARSKFSHYASRPLIEVFDHAEHIHMEISLEARQGLLPFYRNARPQSALRPPPPSRTVAAPPRTPRTVAPAPRSQSTRAVGTTPNTALPGTSPPAGVDTPRATVRTVTREVPTAQTADAGETETDPQDSFKELFKLYAQYEYLKQRYMVRQTAIQMRFNPYVVPGFPSMMFDSMRTRLHMVGYIQSITHSASASGGGSISTQVQMTCCRTLPEFINDVRSDAERFACRVTAAPAEIIDEIRIRIQDEDNAEAFYRRLFYGDGPRPGNAPTAFRWDQAMGYSRGNDVESIQIDGERLAVHVERAQSEAETRRNANNPDATPATTPATTPEAAPSVDHNLDPNLDLSPRENIYQDAFDSYDVAMQLASRPACTLEQYIRFWHAGKTLNDLINSNLVVGPRDIFSFAQTEANDITETRQTSGGVAVNVRGPVRRDSAVYYDRIYRLRPGPGTGEDHMTGPTAPERGYTDPPTLRPSPTHAGVAADYPQSRADWDSVLEQYRDKVRTALRPSV